MDEIVTTELTEREEYLLNLAQSAKSTYDTLFEIVWGEEWKTYTLPEAIRFRNDVEAYFAQATVIREKFDADVWKGHANGTVDPSIESIRKQREGDTPGKKATPPTADSVLAKRLSK